MKIKRFSQLAVAVLLALTPPSLALAKGWENPRTERTDTRTIVKESDIEIRAARGVILVTTTHPVQIKIFTILGQLISSETVPAGTFQYTVSAHGVYIIKAGDLTCKVAL